MIPRKDPNRASVHSRQPIFIHSLALTQLGIFRKDQIISILLYREMIPDCKKALTSSGADRVVVRYRGWARLGAGQSLLQSPSADRVAQCHAHFSVHVRGIFVADNSHAMALQATAPARRSIRLADLPRRHERMVAFGADVVIAVAALVAMETRATGRNGMSTDVAVHGDCLVDVTVLLQMRDRGEGLLRRILASIAQSAEMGYRQ